MICMLSKKLLAPRAAAERTQLPERRATCQSVGGRTGAFFRCISSRFARSASRL